MVEKLIKLFISPNYINAPLHVDNAGIRRVVEAENKYLPQFGVESIARVEEADIIQNHGAMQTFRHGIPIINTSHGLYWSRHPWGAGMSEINADLVKAMSMANAQTAPSEWVARAIARGGFWYPEVIYHGVDSGDFKPSDKPSNYVLWNKARADFVSNPEDMQRVAAILKNVKFLSTIGKQAENVTVFGVKPYAEMKNIVANAGVYLCTARETFGIGTLEALASGVPVAGWNWGGQAEIIIQGETGYLAEPGNFEQLAECIQKCLDERQKLSLNCVEDARTRWQWEPRIQQYADLVKKVYDEYHVKKRPKVSIIVTSYNLDKYLPACLESVSKQTFDDFECLVIDDAQSDKTKELVFVYSSQDQRIKYVPTPENLGLPGARNFGFVKSKGRYLRYLDADDYLSDNAVGIEAEALDADPYSHVVYGHLCMIEEDGRVPLVQGSPERAGWPSPNFSWIEQMAHLNQLPSCAMMRREVMERSGGYRVRNKRQEDAEFWCRITSLGFRAKKITETITYFHRIRGDSKGQVEWNTQGAEPDWTAWFPWRIGARNSGEGTQLLRKYGGMHPDPTIVPFGAQGKAPEVFWYINDYSYPRVSIIVTCGPGHKAWLIDALDSIQAQTYPDWECIVVNDTGEKWGKYIPGAPWARVVNMEGNQGAAAARNAGARYARSANIIWMDADDYWLPWFLERMMAYGEKNDGIIYSDLIMDDGKEKKVYRYKDVAYHEVPMHMSYPGSSILVPIHIAQAVWKLQKGFDSKIPGMEDWDYQIAVHSLGFCAHHIAEPLFVYRLFTSTKRETDYARIDDIRSYLDNKWVEYRKEGKTLMCGCNASKKTTAKPVSTLSSSGNFMQSLVSIPEGTDPNQMVLVEYIGPLAETFSIRSRVDRGINYRFGNNPLHKEKTVFMADAYMLIGMTDSSGKPTYRMKGITSANMVHNPEDVVGAIVA